jgi:hypothetical protein
VSSICRRYLIATAESFAFLYHPIRKLEHYPLENAWVIDAVLLNQPISSNFSHHPLSAEFIDLFVLHVLPVVHKILLSPHCITSPNVRVKRESRIPKDFITFGTAVEEEYLQPIFDNAPGKLLGSLV